MKVIMLLLKLLATSPMPAISAPMVQIVNLGICLLRSGRRNRAEIIAPAANAELANPKAIESPENVLLMIKGIRTIKNEVINMVVKPVITVYHSSNRTFPLIIQPRFISSHQLEFSCFLFDSFKGSILSEHSEENKLLIAAIASPNVSGNNPIIPPRNGPARDNAELTTLSLLIRSDVLFVVVISASSPLDADSEKEERMVITIYMIDIAIMLDLSELPDLDINKQAAA